MLRIIAALLVIAAGLARAGDSPLRIFLLSGSKEYRSEESLTALKAFLEKRFPVRCLLSCAKERGKVIPRLGDLDTCQVLVVFCKRMQLARDTLQALRAHFRSGRAVVGIRTASHAFQTYLAFDREILGGDYRGHGGFEKDIAVDIDPESAGHPVCEAVTPWKRPGKLYRNPHPAPDIKVLLWGTGAKERQPVAWVRVYDRKKKARAFYTSLGYPHDFRNNNFRRLLVNAIFWTAKREVPPVAPHTGG